MVDKITYLLNKLFLLIRHKAWPGTRGKTEKQLDNSAAATNSASEKTATSRIVQIIEKKQIGKTTYEL